MGIKNIIGELQVNGSPVVTEEALQDLDIKGGGAPIYYYDGELVFSSTYATDRPEPDPEEQLANSVEKIINLSDNILQTNDLIIDRNGVLARVDTLFSSIEFSVVFLTLLAGEDGKSAYEYAKDGGYTGTEEEFQQALAGIENNALPITGGTLTGELKINNASGSTVAKINQQGYVVGTWLQGTASNAMGSKPPRICVQDNSGWIYSRTPEQILEDIGAESEGTATSAVSTHNTDTSSHTDIREQIKGISNSIPQTTSDLTNDSGFITKAVSDLTNYYTKSNSYDKTEVNSLISKIPKFNIEVSNPLPLSGISPSTIYIKNIPNPTDNENLFEEYIFIPDPKAPTGDSDNGLYDEEYGAWELLGTQKAPAVPTKTSELTNDTGFITSSDIPIADATTAGITIVYPSSSCTTYTSEVGTCTPAAVKKAVSQFGFPASGGNITGHLYLSGAKPASSTGNTTQVIFGTENDQHLALSSNTAMLVLNPNSTSTANQILLKLGAASSFPKGILAGGVSPLSNKGSNLGAATQMWNLAYADTFVGKLQGNADTATKATQDSAGNFITSTYATKDELSSQMEAMGNSFGGALEAIYLIAALQANKGAFHWDGVTTDVQVQIPMEGMDLVGWLTRVSDFYPDEALRAFIAEGYMMASMFSLQETQDPLLCSITDQTEDYIVISDGQIIFVKNDNTTINLSGQDLLFPKKGTYFVKAETFGLPVIYIQSMYIFGHSFAPQQEVWTFELEDGTTVSKKISVDKY